MTDRCSIHISKESHAILNATAKKYAMQKYRLIDFLVLNGCKMIEEDQTQVLKISQQIAITMQPPSAIEIINTLFDRAALEDRIFVWQWEIRKATKLLPAEVQKLGYLKYFPDGKNVLAWMKK